MRGQGHQRLASRADDDDDDGDIETGLLGSGSHRGPSVWLPVGFVVVAFVVVIGVLTVVRVRSPAPRVVAARAEPPFRCGDGATVIDGDRVNDDYCDCPDGSDETGTSACSHIRGVRFRCSDALSIPASMVGDGVCDCPDCIDR
ncbi:Glucosidase II beta subunit-like [Plasmodiophora brassicae]